jgi:hypothetical protein
VPERRLDATEPLRCHDYVHSNDDDVSAERVDVLSMRHFAEPEMRSDATEPLRCHDCVHSNDDDDLAEHVAVISMRHFVVPEIRSDATDLCDVMTVCTLTMTM